jgi:MFS family permease
MTIYLPIFLHIEIGFSLTEIIGVIFPIALLPFILLELPLGKLADQRHDEKELLSLGFLILALSTGSIAFITSQNIFVWAGVLFLGRIGAALVEVASATYFFKKVNASNTNLISMFRSLNPMATIAAPLVATSFLFAFDMSYRYLFVILALILLVGMPISKRLQRIGND